MLGHGDLDADVKNIFARKPALDARLVGVHDDRVMIVDEHRAQRRVEVVALEMASDIEDVERARSRRDQVGAREPVGGLWKRKA